MRKNHIVGPVALITVGVLFLVQYFTPYSFWRNTWPILLIAIGAALVLQRSSGSGPSAPASTPAGLDTSANDTSEKR